LPYYQNPSVPEQRDAQGYALTHYAGNSHVLKKNEALSLSDFTDGASSTVLAGDVSAGYQPWGSPENTRDPAAGLGASPTQFGSVHVGICQFLMGDGSVRAVSENVSPGVLKAIATPDGKEPAVDF
jgi:hypothetical protein